MTATIETPVQDKWRLGLEGLPALLFDKLSFEVSGEEQAAILRCRKRFKLVTGGERAGKSKVAAKDWDIHFLEDSVKWPDEMLLYWLVAADYERTRAEFGYIQEDLEKLGMPVEATKRVDPGYIEVKYKDERQPRLRIETKSGKDPRTLAMFAPHGIIICEASQIDLETYFKCTARLAEKRGWLHMSGCLTGETLVATDEGLLSLGEVVGDRTHPIEIGVHGLTEGARATLAWSNGRQPVKRVTLTKGFEIAGTWDHRVIARLPDGSVTWIALQDLTAEHLVAIRYGMDLWGPREWTDEEAYLAGVYIAEGSWEADELPMQGRMALAGVGRHAVSGRGRGRPGIPRKQQRTKDRITFTLGPSDGEIKTIISALGYHHHGYHWRLTDPILARTFREIGIDPLWKSHTKEVPSGMMRATRRNVVAFLQGLFDGDGTVRKKVGSPYQTNIRLDTASEVLAHQVQLLLLNLGVPSSITHRTNKLGVKSFLCYSVNILHAKFFMEHVGFRLEAKRTLALSVTATPKFFRNQANAGRECLGFPVLWCSPIKIEDDIAATYDLHVPGEHAYWANGLIAHNTLEGSLGFYPGLAAAWRHGGKDEQSFLLPATSNRFLYPLGEKDPELLRLKANSSDAFFMERIMGLASPPKGMVFHEFRPDIHIREVEYDPDLPIYIWDDPGYGHAHAIEVAQVAQGGQVQVKDEIFERGMITQDMIQVCMMRPWWKNPNKTLVIDPNYATQHHAAPSVADIWASAPAFLTATGTKVKISEGIERIKSFLKVNPLTGEPGIVFSPKCKGVLSEFGAYPDPFDGQTRVYSWKMDREGNVVGDEPEDRWNDGISALRYGIVERFGLASGGGEKFFPMKRYGVPIKQREVGYVR